MKQSLVALLALLILAAGVFAVAAPRVDDQRDAVSITEERRYGDPAAADGLTVTAVTSLDGYLHWDTTVTLGRELTWDTEFRFTSQREFHQEPSRPYLYLAVNGGFGISSSELDLSQLGDWEQAVRDAAAQTPAGAEDYPVTLDASDYWDVYPLTLDGNLWMAGTEQAYFWGGLWPEAGDFFRIPMLTDSAELLISKDPDGTVYAVQCNLLMRKQLESYSAICDDGRTVYLAVSLYNPDRDAYEPVESRAGYGVFRLPMTQLADGSGNLWDRVDNAGVELVYPVDGEKAVVDGLDFTPDQRYLLLRTVEAGQRRCTVLDAATMEPVQTFSLCSADTWVNAFWIGEDYLALYTGDSRAKVWQQDGQGRYAPRVDADISAALPQETWGWDAYFDGQRLLLASYVSQYSDPGMDVIVCDGTGLLYGARLYHSQSLDACLSARPRPELDAPLLGSAEE